MTNLNRLSGIGMMAMPCMLVPVNRLPGDRKEKHQAQAKGNISGRTGHGMQK